MSMNVFPACMYAYHVCVWCQQRSEEGVRSSRSGIIWMVVSIHVDAGNHSQVFYKTNKCS